MPLTRRQLLARALPAAGALAACLRIPLAAPALPTPMYGLVGKITAVAGQRDALLAILLDGTSAMPGCLSYVIATDPSDADALWVTEVWESQASHKASLTLPAVQAAIAKGRPMIAGFSNRVETVPVGGIGLPARASR